MSDVQPVPPRAEKRPVTTTLHTGAVQFGLMAQA